MQGYRSGHLCGQPGFTLHTGADDDGIEGLVYQSELSMFDEKSILNFKWKQTEYTTT